MRGLILLIVASFLLSACLSRPGGYYQDDGPHKNTRVDVSRIPDAVPRWEKTDPSRSKPYIVLGKKYFPLKNVQGYRERGIASWYGRKFHGRRTALGEKYDMYAMTAAHKTLPLPSYVRVRNLANGQNVIVRVNDRGPFLHNRLIDLSYAAAHRLGVLKTGTAKVEVSLVTPDDIGSQARALPDENTKDIQVESLEPLSKNNQDSQPVNELYLQVGAFRTAERAENLRTRLEQAKFTPVLVLPVKNPTRRFYRVRIGPLDNNIQGEMLTRKLADMGFADAHLVRD